MKTIGMIGGMSWESTVSYYKAINRSVKEALGESHSAKIWLYSLDFEEIKTLQHQGEWQKAAKILSDAAQKLETAGADFLMICANTMHKVAEEVQAEIFIPVLHIADVTADALVADGVTKVGLLGTQFTMGESFYKDRVSEKYGIEVIVPEKSQQEIVHNIIYAELIMGEIKDDSRQRYLEVIEQLHAQGAQAVILGCTEIALLVQQHHTKVPLYDTTDIHAAHAVMLALSSQSLE
ncbi:MAG: aspartate/glutamate racemase family protein [Pseudomonadales bacterium]|jgi:aspartate racemase|nr:aspartate/glutamate racemase family protein [Pseudomonadales bacterium]